MCTKKNTKKHKKRKARITVCLVSRFSWVSNVDARLFVDVIYHSVIGNGGKHLEKQRKRHKHNKKQRSYFWKVVVFIISACIINMQQCRSHCFIKNYCSSLSSLISIRNCSNYWNKVLYLQIVYNMIIWLCHQWLAVWTNRKFITSIFPIGLFKDMHG